MPVERVTSLLELVGILLLSTAVALAVYQRFGLIAALTAAGVLAFGWSFLLAFVHRGEPEQFPARIEEAP